MKFIFSAWISLGHIYTCFKFQPFLSVLNLPTRCLKMAKIHILRFWAEVEKNVKHVEIVRLNNYSFQNLTLILKNYTSSSENDFELVR